MRNEYSFVYNKQSYIVDWSEDDRVLKLRFIDYSGTILGVRIIPLLGIIDQKQLDNIVKDYWKSFVKTELTVESK
jgi:hypothetical protein